MEQFSDVSIFFFFFYNYYKFLYKEVKVQRSEQARVQCISIIAHFFFSLDKLL